ncbi:hypothetical protein [Pseudomonas sp. S1(2024)]|uniref:hypothetical protein n=1 Tax=Pseudomonas sp. S1(2024) TaxID=3390191 RepID=UPI00397A1B9F
MKDYSQLKQSAAAAKAAHPGDPWHYQENSDVYTHIVRVNNPKLNNSMIVAQLGQRTDGVSETVARYIAGTNPDVILELISELESLRAQVALGQSGESLV